MRIKKRERNQQFSELPWWSLRTTAEEAKSMQETKDKPRKEQQNGTSRD